MTKRTICVITAVLILFISGPAFGGPKFKGGGGKVGETSNRAEFVFPSAETITGAVLAGDVDNESIFDGSINQSTGDGLSSYMDSDASGDAGISAYFMGSGNPKLKIDSLAERSLIVRFDGEEVGCGLNGTFEAEARGDGLWFSGLSEDENGCVQIYSGWDWDRFLSMKTDGSDGTLYSNMILRFLQTENNVDYLYTVEFGKDWCAPYDPPEPESSRVTVTRSGDTWTITGISEGISTASVRKGNVKGKRVTTELGNCSAEIYFQINLLPSGN